MQSFCPQMKMPSKLPGFYWSGLTLYSRAMARIRWSTVLEMYFASLQRYNWSITFMKVFISYGSATDQVTALRLQALAAVNGLKAYVPPADTRMIAPSTMDLESRQKLMDTDVILGVVGTAGFTPAFREEINTGFTLQKNTIILSDPIFEPQLRPNFGANLVVLNPANPAEAETGIVQYLKTIHAKQKEQKALLALSTLAIGLLLFAAVAHD
jgi:hypothetical protein